MQRLNLAAIVTVPVAAEGFARVHNLLAVAAVRGLAVGCPRIYRREPTAEDLAAVNVAVVDCGGRHEPWLNNYDHHAFGRFVRPTNTLALVFDHVGLLPAAREYYRWLDGKGLDLGEAWFPPQLVYGWFLNKFGQATELNPGDRDTYDFVTRLGHSLLAQVERYREFMAKSRPSA